MSRRFLILCALLAPLLTTPAAVAEKAPLIPANELLLGHSNFFQPVQVYDLLRDAIQFTQDQALRRDQLGPHHGRRAADLHDLVPKFDASTP